MEDINALFKKVSESANIVDVVSSFLGAQNIKKQGKNYLCLCPFHDDKHPSMSLDPTRNIFKCFSCGKGGDIFGFVSEYKHISKFEALKEIAKISNISLPEIKTKSYQSNYDKHPSEASAIKDLNDFYNLILFTEPGQKGLEYLHNRGLSDEIIKKFNIGFAPSNKKMSIDALISKKHEIPTLINAGILSSSTTLSDRLFNRIIFPLKDYNGNIVAFSGRLIEKSYTVAKYLNYSDTVLFNKGNVLYNFDQAKISVKKNKYLYIVEGYMDAIAYYRAGIEEVIATMGTNLSEKQISAIKSLDVEVRLSFDSDRPGQENQLKVLRNLLLSNIKVKCVRPFKDYKDADEVISNSGKDKLKEFANNLLDPFLYTLFVHLNGRKELINANEINNFISNSKYIYNLLDEITKSKDLEILEKVTKVDKKELIKLYESKKEIENDNKIIIKNNNDKTKNNKYVSNKDLIKEKINTNFDPDKKNIACNNIKDLYKVLNLNSISEREYYLEVELIISCFNNLDAVMFLDNEKFSFHFTPFNELFYILQFVYQNHIGKKNINDELYNDIYNILFVKEEKQSEFEGIDLSDLYNNNEYGRNIAKYEKEFLQNHLEEFKIFTIDNDNDFDFNSFKAIYNRIIKYRNAVIKK